MGATLSTESVLTAVAVVGALGVGYHQYTASPNAAGSIDTPTPVSKQTKKKKKKAPEDKKASLSSLQSVPVVDSSAASDGAIPGQFDDLSNASTPQPKKSKKKKSQPSTVDPVAQHTTKPPESTSIQRSEPLQQSTTSIDTDESWTRVESRKKAGKGAATTGVDVTTTSDAGIMSSVTESSSPVEEESTLAEKLVPKPPETEVDDMLPEHPTLSRVMRIQPLPHEHPAPGFSWADYDNVHLPEGEGNDADREDDGWGVVKTKRPRPKREPLPVAQAPEALTKKQRQNANKREAQKTAKAAAEAERVATLAKHKRELEQIRMMEQSRSSKKGKTSGGMTPVVDDRGKLVWE
ncbi:hypothetical protein AN958_12212 [Leucoagaricus sp. SymC.cos]|nr:hypothetical protein AN958_12212 [Leucoagaricus sp. SymC.cos]